MAGATPKKRAAAPRARRVSAISLRQRLVTVLPWFWVSGIGALLLAGVIYLPTVMNHYPIREVGVDGVNDQRRQQQLQVALGDLLHGANYFSVPLSEIYQRTEGLSWVESVSVRRQWPETLLLTVDERRPMAVWNEAQLVADSGHLFQALKQYDVAGLPRLNGPDNRLDEVMGFYHSMARLLSEVDLSITQMDVNARLTARLTLDNQVQVVVDREHYAAKLRRFVQLYRGVLSDDSRPLQRVDLRYADGMAVTWNEHNGQG